MVLPGQKITYLKTDVDTAHCLDAPEALAARRRVGAAAGLSGLDAGRSLGLLLASLGEAGKKGNDGNGELHYDGFLEEYFE